MEEEIVNLKGTIEEIIFYNEENGYTVFNLVSQEGELVTVVGEFLNLVVGEGVLLKGKWDVHPSFGRQLKAQLVERTMPKDESSMLMYLSSGIIKGIGDSIAVKIIEAFGMDSFDVIENDPIRLSSIKGISRKKARDIQKAFKMQISSRQTVEKLINIGFEQAEALNAYKMFGGDAYDIISENPYVFVGNNGYDFERAEDIAENLTSQNLFEYRSQAAVIFTVTHNLENGHTCLPRNAVKKATKSYLNCTEDEVEIAIDNAIEANQLMCENIDGKDFLFLPHIYEAEVDIANRICVMVNYPPQQVEIYQSEISAFESSRNIEFDEKQKLAIEIAVNKGLLILTGGPGTGKTTTVKGIITLMKNKGLNVALAAPTGRAAKRMSELTGFEAKTIHRLLEVEYKNGAEEPSFVYNMSNPLDIDAVIIDELSMVDVLLFSSLLDALPMHARLIMVGDKNQLPPVGAGNVLKDLMQSGMIPVVELDKIFRQAEESLIVTNAHKVVKGEMPELTRNDLQSDFFLLKENSGYNAQRKIVDLVTRRIPNMYGLNPLTDIEVLCPSRKGYVGTENINILLQKKLNPPSKDKKEVKHLGYVLREGDKVMQIKNNYDVPWFKNDDNGTGVFNGDIGILTKIDKENDILNVLFDDKEAMYSLDNAKELELAYAMTVHKSQGSEFEAVVMPVLSTPSKLAYRNLFYTAITRAKNLLVLIGNEQSVKVLVDNDNKSRRYSALLHFLKVDNNPLIK